MRQVDVVLSVLTLVAVGMGVAAYRAWHPEPVPAEPVVDTQLAAPLLPVVAPNSSSGRVSRLARLPDSPGPINRVECQHGYLMEQNPEGPTFVIRNGQPAMCEIQAEPAHPRSSPASDDTAER